MIKSLDDAESFYDNMLDEEGRVVIAGITFDRSYILREMDPIAYRCGFNDFMDSMGIDTDELED